MGVPQQLDGLFHGQFQIIMGALVAGLVHGNSQQSVMDDLHFFPQNGWLQMEHPHKYPNNKLENPN